MEITLEKIELVKDRTSVTYKEAKEALEAVDGNVVDAIIAIEETIDIKSNKTFGEKGEALISKMKEIVKKGNVSKIVVKKDNDVLLNIPLTVGVLGGVVAPWGVIVAVVAALGFKCTIEFIKDDGSIIDLSEKAGDFYEDAKDKGADFYEDAKVKAAPIYEDLKEKGTDAFKNAKEKAMDKFNDMKNKKSEGSSAEADNTKQEDAVNEEKKD